MRVLSIPIPIHIYIYYLKNTTKQVTQIHIINLTINYIIIQFPRKPKLLPTHQFWGSLN